MITDPYKSLGIAKTASEAEIKKAYRSLAKQLHPDKNKDNPKAAERFSDITRAYDLLNDADKRARFDRGEIDSEGNPANPFGGGGNPFGGGGGGGFRGAPGGGGFEFGGGDMGDIFEGLFSGGRARPGAGGFGARAAPPPKGGNVNYRLAVPFEDAALLKPQRITLQDGKTIDLKLSPGAETGTQMRLSGKGQVGPGGAGDAIVTIEIGRHAFFVREGNDVRLDLPISLGEAVLGGPIKVPTVDGPVMLGVPKGATSGKVLRLKGRGFTGKDGARGDQLVTLLVDLPLDDAALAEFAKTWNDERDIRKRLSV